MDDSLEAIQSDFLRGIELTVGAFNRLLVWKGQVTPVAMFVKAELVESPRIGEPR